MPSVAQTQVCACGILLLTTQIISVAIQVIELLCNARMDVLDVKTNLNVLHATTGILYTLQPDRGLDMPFAFQIVRYGVLLEDYSKSL